MPLGSHPNQRRNVPLTALAAALTFGAGAIDIASFTRLGGVFSSVMTGNLVLLGLAAAHHVLAGVVGQGGDIGRGQLDRCGGEVVL